MPLLAYLHMYVCVYVCNQSNQIKSNPWSSHLSWSSHHIKSWHFEHYITHKSCQSVCVFTGMMLKENNSLKELRLWNCRLQPEGLEEVIKGVQVNTKLETLILSGNTCDSTSASYLGKNGIIQWGEICTCKSIWKSLESHLCTVLRYFRIN